jgi:tRNA threonylcarbamoyladenosine biosynthesis protein TsaE
LQQFITNSKQETIDLARRMAKKLKAGDIIFFRGGLGMGKTAFTQGLCDGLGIKSIVTSPTFAIVNEYRAKPISLFHFDVYRIENEDQLYNTGYYDYLADNGVTVVEWSENIVEFSPDANITISFERLGENKRKITIEGVEI